MSTSARPAIAAARARLADFFAPRQTRAGVTARRLLGAAAPGDPVLADHLIREMRERTRMDGSTDGSLVKSSWTLLGLVQLDCPPDHASVVRTGGWILARQNQPGRFGEGCDDERHNRGLCQHALAGFFTPGSVDDLIAPLTFPIGVTLADEGEARFAASCLALRAMLRARQERRQGIVDHVVSLLNLGEIWGGWAGPWSPDLVLFALGGVASAPLDHREKVERLADQVARRQRKDGAWDVADDIHAADVMLAIPSATAQAAVKAAGPVIAAMVGELATDATEERSLVALRALLASA